MMKNKWKIRVCFFDADKNPLKDRKFYEELECDSFNDIQDTIMKSASCGDCEIVSYRAWSI